MALRKIQNLGIKFLRIGEHVSRIFPCRNSHNSRRNFSYTALNLYSKAYDGDGKTKVNIFNTELDLGLMITGYSQYGFRLNNDMVIMGPMAIFPRSVLSWNINSYEDIHEDNLAIFYTLEPKIDVLILGIGDQPVSPRFSRTVIEFMKKYKINVEVLRTEQACATFNFLNAENRMVASALIPPVHLSYNENDILQSKIQRKKLYKLDELFE